MIQIDKYFDPRVGEVLFDLIKLNSLKIYLFGSYIYSPAPRDIDIIVVYERGNRELVEYVRFVRLAYFSMPLDLYLFTTNEIDQIKYLDELKNLVCVY